MQSNLPPRISDDNKQCLETRFLLSCLKESDDSELVFSLQEIAKRSIDWNYILKLGYAHGLISLLYLKLKSIPDCDFPTEFSKYLENHYRGNELRNRMLREEFVKLMGAFRKANIRAIPLKGIVYSQTLYNNSSARQFVDIDFILPENDIESAKNLLLGQEFHTVYEDNLLGEGNSELTTLQESIYRSIYHEYSLQSSDRLINIDLHWCLSPRIYPTRIPTELVWSNLVPAEINGLNVHIFSDELDLIYLCMHAAKDGWCELKWAVDISQLIRSRNRLDWNHIWNMCQELRCKKMVLVGLGLANWVTGVILPANIQDEITAQKHVQRAINELKQRLLSRPDRKYSRIPCLSLNKTYLQLCDTNLDRVKYIFRVLTYAQAKDFNILGLTSQLLPIWPLIRPFHLAAHCTKKLLTTLFTKVT